jgi:hypothetical protein
MEERVIALKTDQYRLFDDVNSKMDVCLFVYLLSACNLKVMALVQKG